MRRRKLIDYTEARYGAALPDDTVVRHGSTGRDDVLTIDQRIGASDRAVHCR